MTIEKIVLFDGSADFDARITPQVMTKLKLEFSNYGEKFSPLTEREHDFMHYGVGFSLASGAYCRIPRMYLINGVKVFNLSDDDYYDSAEDQVRLEQFTNNSSAAKAIYTEIALAFGVDLLFEYEPGREYWADIYIPMFVFDFLKTGEDFASYFEERKYLTCRHARKFKNRQSGALKSLRAVKQKLIKLLMPVPL